MAFPLGNIKRLSLCSNLTTRQLLEYTPNITTRSEIMTVSSTSGPVEVPFDAFLFDMDGTIMDSTAAIVKYWEVLAAEIGTTAEVILQTSHGRRSIDMLKTLCPRLATWEYVREMEGRLPREHGDDAVEIPGARSLITSLIAHSAPWAIVTSGTETLVHGWLNRLSLPQPATLVTAESVTDGKPSPLCYLQAREKMGFAGVGDIVVLEDAPAGIKAGKAAGCKVVALVTSHTLEQVAAAGPDWIVKDLESVKVTKVDRGKVTIRISDILSM